MEQLKSAIAKHRNIQHCWHFSPRQQQVLQQYYNANQLLIDCLNSNCEITDVVRQEIEASLLLPRKELSEREWQRAGSKGEVVVSLSPLPLLPNALSNKLHFNNQI